MINVPTGTKTSLIITLVLERVACWMYLLVGTSVVQPLDAWRSCFLGELTGDSTIVAGVKVQGNHIEKTSYPFH